jgi:hypothetical protein
MKAETFTEDSSAAQRFVYRACLRGRDEYADPAVYLVGNVPAMKWLERHAHAVRSWRLSLF